MNVSTDNSTDRPQDQSLGSVGSGHRIGGNLSPWPHGPAQGRKTTSPYRPVLVQPDTPLRRRVHRGLEKPPMRSGLRGVSYQPVAPLDHLWARLECLGWNGSNLNGPTPRSRPGSTRLGCLGWDRRSPAFTSIRSAGQRFLALNLWWYAVPNSGPTASAPEWSNSVPCRVVTSAFVTGSRSQHGSSPSGQDAVVAAGMKPYTVFSKPSALPRVKRRGGGCCVTTPPVP